LNAKEQNKSEELEKRLENIGNRFGGKLTEIRQLKGQLQNQKELQSEIQQLKVKLVNYTQFIFQEILTEQERIKILTNTNSDNWLIALERQQKLINQLKEIFGNELNNEQLRMLLQLQEQLTNLQVQLYKIQIKETREQNNTLIQTEVIQLPFYNKNII
jgi:hypothetical protein